MDGKLFNIVLVGKVRDGYDRSVVSTNLVALLKLPIEQVETLLNGNSLVVKRSVDAVLAAKYKAAIERAGVCCSVDAVAPEPPLEFDLSTVTASTPQPPQQELKKSDSLETPLAPTDNGASTINNTEKQAMTPNENHNPSNSDNKNPLVPSVNIDDTVKFYNQFVMTFALSIGASILLSALHLDSIAKLFKFLVILALVYLVAQLAKSLNKNIWLWVVLMLIPLVNLVALVVIIRECVNIFKSLGYKNGLFGVKKM